MTELITQIAQHTRKWNNNIMRGNIYLALNNKLVLLAEVHLAEDLFVVLALEKCGLEVGADGI